LNEKNYVALALALAFLNIPKVESNLPLIDNFIPLIENKTS